MAARILFTLDKNTLFILDARRYINITNKPHNWNLLAHLHLHAEQKCHRAAEPESMSQSIIKHFMCIQHKSESVMNQCQLVQKLYSYKYGIALISFTATQLCNVAKITDTENCCKVTHIAQPLLTSLLFVCFYFLSLYCWKEYLKCKRLPILNNPFHKHMWMKTK